LELMPEVLSLALYRAVSVGWASQTPEIKL